MTAPKLSAATVKRVFPIAHECCLTISKCNDLIEQFSHFSGSVTISNGAISVDGRSLNDMLQLATIARFGLTIELTGRGADRMMTRIMPLLITDVEKNLDEKRSA